MLAGTWPNSEPSDAYALRFDRSRAKRLLIIPALFDEANKLRRMTVEAMRALDREGIDSALMDLPGTNESLAHLADQSLDSWRSSVDVAAESFAATHVLGMRAGALLSGETLPLIVYAPQTGASQVRAMARARIIADREAGIETSREELLESGEREGIVLAGYALSAQMVRDLQQAEIPNHVAATITQSDLGGSPLWLRAEPDEDASQSKALAANVVELLA